MSEGHELPDDSFHANVYLMLDAVCCAACAKRPNLVRAWDGVPDGEAGAKLFAIRTVGRLNREGWRMDMDFLLCPACAAKRAASDCSTADSVTHADGKIRGTEEKRNTSQVSLKWLLAVVTLAAVCFGAFRLGYFQRKDAMKEHPSDPKEILQRAIERGKQQRARESMAPQE